MSDLFGFGQPAIAWDGMKGKASDGRPIEIDMSVLTGRFVATIPLFGRDCATRRARRTIEECRAAAEQAVRESQP